MLQIIDFSPNSLKPCKSSFSVKLSKITSIGQKEPNLEESRNLLDWHNLASISMMDLIFDEVSVALGRVKVLIGTQDGIM